MKRVVRTRENNFPLIKIVFIFFLAIICFCYRFKTINKTDIDEIIHQKQNGCIIILLRNRNLPQLLNMIKRFELVFNKNYRYPYILLNNKNFTSFFKKKIQKHTKSIIEYGLIDKKHWDIPQWIDMKRLYKSRKSIGFSNNYRQMCRYFSGFFFRHELTLKYDYYMRLDSNSNFKCEISKDPFLKLSHEKKKYGFILSDAEETWTIPTLWDTIKEWRKMHDIRLNNAITFTSDNKGDALNADNCMFYDNFEMAAFSVFRNKTYLDYFDHLDQSGGFFYERWVI